MERDFKGIIDSSFMDEDVRDPERLQLKKNLLNFYWHHNAINYNFAEDNGMTLNSYPNNSPHDQVMDYVAGKDESLSKSREAVSGHKAYFATLEGGWKFLNKKPNIDRNTMQDMYRNLMADIGDPGSQRERNVDMQEYYNELFLAGFDTDEEANDYIRFVYDEYVSQWNEMYGKKAMSFSQWKKVFAPYSIKDYMRAMETLGIPLDISNPRLGVPSVEYVPDNRNFSQRLVDFLTTPIW